jgi:hypothetical protein
MSSTRIVIAAASLALMSAGASAQVGFRIGGGGIGIGLGLPLYGGQERPHSVERYRAPQRTDRVQRKRNSDDDEVKTAKKTTAPEEAKARNENSSIASVASDKDKGAPTPAVTEQKKTDVATSERSRSNNENSAIASAASNATATADPVKAQVTTADTDGGAKSVATCKRYFPTVGQTITVPCD